MYRAASAADYYARVVRLAAAIAHGEGLTITTTRVVRLLFNDGR